MDNKYLNLIDDKLRAYLPLVKQLPGEEQVLIRTARIMNVIDNPQDKLKIIHIAGTSGKTSTTYYLSSLLAQSNKKVGQLISPHVDRITERIQIDGKYLTPKEFYLLLIEFLSIIETQKLVATYFEILYAFGFWVFDRNNVDYAVIETGIGGKYDATNIARIEDKVCVITAIGYDHMNILGHSLVQIAEQKAGIIHHNNQAIVLKQSKEILTVIKKRVNECNAKLIIVNDWNQNIQLIKDLPKFQKLNWSVAKRAYDYLRERDGLAELNQDQLTISCKTYIPARMETIRLGNKIIIMDAAHNKQKLQAIVDGIKEKYPQQKVTIILGMKKDKDRQDISKIINQIAELIIITAFKTTIDLPTKAANPDLLSKELVNQGSINVKSINDLQSAFKLALKEKNKIILVTGSFYLISQLRASGVLSKA